MMRALVTAELFVLALLCFTVLSVVICSLLAPVAIKRLETWQPGKRHTALWAWCAAPTFSTLTLFTATVSPAFASLFAPARDHCFAHDDGHAHLCFVHPSEHAPHALLWAFVAVVVVFVAWRALRSFARAIRCTRVLRALVRTGTTDSQRAAIVLEDDTAVCIAAGLVRPRILISRGLLATLTPEQSAALFAHEQSHARRRDALARFTAGLLSGLYLPGIRQRLLRELEVSAEQACDEAAALAIGDRLVVADTILAVERATGQTSLSALAPLAVGMGQLAIESRIQALLEEPRRKGRFRGPVAGLLALSIALWLEADALHHTVESVLSHVLH